MGQDLEDDRRMPSGLVHRPKGQGQLASNRRVSHLSPVFRRRCRERNSCGFGDAFRCGETVAESRANPSWSQRAVLGT